MPASDAYAWVGKSVSAQRCSPAAERRIIVSMSGLRAFWARAWRLGSAWESSRALASAMITIRTSVFSAIQSAVGGSQSSWASLASS